METVEALMGGLFNVALVIMIVATMFAAGLATTLSALGKIFKNVWLLILVLVVALVIRPLVGWGLAEAFALATPIYIAILILAACPGAPLGAKMVMNAKGDLPTGASLQVILAAIGTITFPITANLMITGAGLGQDISIPVADLIRTVALLQLLPFAVGICVCHWGPKHAMDWRPTVVKVSTYTLFAVLALALLGSWSELVALAGSWGPLVGVLFAAIMIPIGWFIAKGDRKTRIATSLIEPGSNAGPAFAAVAIAFNNDPEILGAMTAIIFLQIIVVVVAAAFIGKRGGKDEDGPAEAGPS